MTNQTSRVLLALAVLLSIGCRKVAIDVGADAGPDGATAGGSTATEGSTATGGNTATGGSTATGGKGSAGRMSSATSSKEDPSSGGSGGSGGQKTSSSSIGWTTFMVPQSPQRAIDILFVVDNSPSMDPKQAALAKAFPKMMQVLQAVEGGIPDVHIGVISSDMGAGATEAGGNCSVLLGNEGILWGNDPNADPARDNNQLATVKNVMSSSGVNGCGMNSGARWIEDILNVDGLTRSKNYQGNLSDVFSCLAKAVGVAGCGYEHTLQSLRVALNPDDRINPQNFKFLRAQADLAIVIVSDEDDCSADPNSGTNDGMFFPRTLGDTASLRCATRGHVCNSQEIPNYDPASGYTSALPFVANLADCEAKDDTSSNRDYKSLPLIRIEDMIKSVKQVKNRPEEQIMVAGIIGWPENGDLSGVQYRIDKDPTAMPAEQQKLWNYMPICTRPDQKSADGNIYKAYAGLRLKKFIDGFGSNGQVYSICSPDTFANAMQQIGNALARRLKPGCVQAPLVDSNPSLPETQPQCTVVDKIACNTPGTGGCLASGYKDVPLPECIDPTTGNPLSPSNPAKANIPDDARPCWYLVYDTTPNTGCSEAPLAEKISVLRKGDGMAPAGTLLQVACRTCDSLTDPRCASH